MKRLCQGMHCHLKHYDTLINRRRSYGDMYIVYTYIYSRYKYIFITDSNKMYHILEHYSGFSLVYLSVFIFRHTIIFVPLEFCLYKVCGCCSQMCWEVMWLDLYGLAFDAHASASQSYEQLYILF